MKKKEIVTILKNKIKWAEECLQETEYESEDYFIFWGCANAFQALLYEIKHR